MFGITTYNYDASKKNVMFLHGAGNSYKTEKLSMKGLYGLTEPIIKDMPNCNIIWVDLNVFESHLKKNVVDLLPRVTATISKIKSKPRVTFNSYKEKYEFILNNNLGIDHVDELYFTNVSFRLNFDKSKHLDKIFEENRGYNFQSFNNSTSALFNALAIAQKFNKTLKHIVIDPNEPNLKLFSKYNNVERYSGYTSKILDFKRIDYFLNTHRNEPIYNDTKEIDLFAGFSVITKDRFFIYDYTCMNTVKNSKICINDKYKNIFTGLPFNEYIKLIRKVKAQIIFPSYNREAFSFIRFYESIFSGCIPLVLTDCNISEFIDSEEERKLLEPLFIDNNSNLQEKIDKLHDEQYIIKLQNFYKNVK